MDMPPQLANYSDTIRSARHQGETDSYRSKFTTATKTKKTHTLEFFSSGCSTLRYWPITVYYFAPFIIMDSQGLVNLFLSHLYRQPGLQDGLIFSIHPPTNFYPPHTSY